MRRIILFIIIILLILTVNTYALFVIDNRYYYSNQDYYKSCWQWLDLNNDGIYECYYFNVLGHMTKNSITPDGYRVNEKGEWIVDGVVQRKDNIGIIDSINSNLGNIDTNIYFDIIKEVNADFSLYIDNFINDRIFDIKNYINVKEIDRKSLEELRSKYIRDMDIIYNNYYKSLIELYDNKQITRESIRDTIDILSSTLKDKKKILNNHIDYLKNTITWQFTKEEYNIKKPLIE